MLVAPHAPADDKWRKDGGGEGPEGGGEGAEGRMVGGRQRRNEKQGAVVRCWWCNR